MFKNLLFILLESSPILNSLRNFEKIKSSQMTMKTNITSTESNFNSLIHKLRLIFNN